MELPLKVEVLRENLHRIDPEVIGQIDGSPLTIAGLYEALLAIINEFSFQVYGDGDEADVDHIRDIALHALTGYVYNDEDWKSVKDQFKMYQDFDPEVG